MSPTYQLYNLRSSEACRHTYNAHRTSLCGFITFVRLFRDDVADSLVYAFLNTRTMIIWMRKYIRTKRFCRNFKHSTVWPLFIEIIPALVAASAFSCLSKDLPIFKYEKANWAQRINREGQRHRQCRMLTSTPRNFNSLIVSSIQQFEENRNLKLRATMNQA